MMLVERKIPAEVSCRLSAMLFQESTKHYLLEDYLKLQRENKNNYFALIQRSKCCQVESNTSNDCCSEENRVVNEHRRQEVAEWFCTLIHALNLNRQILPISMSYFDRFLSLYICDKSFLTLTASTCIFLAVKVHDPEKLQTVAAIVPQLSRGEIDVRQILGMEIFILKSLQWFVHPPTAEDFAMHFLALVRQCIPDIATQDTLQTLEDFVRRSCELSVFDYFFVPKKASHVALAAVFNGLEWCSLSGPCAHDCPDIFLAILRSEYSDLEKSSEEICQVRAQLWMLYNEVKEKDFHHVRSSRYAESEEMPILGKDNL